MTNSTEDSRLPMLPSNPGDQGGQIALVDAAEHVLDVGLVDPHPGQPGLDPGQGVLDLVGVLGDQGGELGEADDGGDQQAGHDRDHPEQGHQGGQPAGCAAADYPAAERVHDDGQDQRQEHGPMMLGDGAHPGDHHHGGGQPRR